MNYSPAPEPYNTAPQRLAALIDQLLAAVPGTTIIVAQIISSSNPGTRDRIPVYNAAIPGIVSARARAGKKVQLINMSSIGVNGANLADGLHPNDFGYTQMADFWLQGLQKASNKGWITPPQ